MFEITKLSIVVAAYNQWEKYTQPMIDSLRKYNPDVPLVVVDNGSEPPYPIDLGNNTLVIRSDNEGLAKANNIGIVHCPISEWYFMLNNDVIVSGDILEHIEQLTPDAIYGNKLTKWQHSEYVDGWCFVIPRQALLEVGLYDENYKKIYYDEVDYCYRAEQHGYKMRKINLPVTHLGDGGGSRHFNDSDEIARINSEWFLAKHGLERDK